MSTVLDRLAAALADRYRIERELGAGGMATVYLAHDVKHDRDVALKVLRPELAASLGHERFLREITTIANLRHPHIVPLYDSGEVAASVFYVMPFVDGESLRDRLDREKQLPLEDALRITREVADALDHAHGRGVIHRDIKPENILLEHGHAVVTDFGIARAASAAGLSTLTQTGTAIGTPAYMSPEQAAGSDDLDGRSDMYALGCVLYEMLTGQPPFTGRTLESVLHQQIAVTARPVRELRTSVSAHVDTAVSRALAKSPADRYATLASFAAGLNADVRAASPPGRRLPRRMTFAALATVAVIATAAIAWPLVSGGGDDADLDGDVIAVMPFRVGGDPAPTYLPLEREVATTNERDGASLVDLGVRFVAGREPPVDFRVDNAYGPGWAATFIHNALIEPAYRPLAADVIADDAAGEYPLPTATGPMPWPPSQLCFAELLHVAEGDTVGTRSAVRRLRDFAALDPPPLPPEQWLPLDFRVCPLLLEVLLEGVPRPGERRARLDALDALMRDGPRWFGAAAIVAPTAYANFTIALLREAQGDLPAALRAVRRRETDYFPAYLWSLPAFLRLEGRLAARAGDVAGAVSAYDRYLTLRTDPFPPLRAQRDSVLAERAALVSGGDL